MLRIESSFQALSELPCGTHTPVVQEDYARRLHRHVIMDGNNVDVGAAQGFEDGLQFRLQHGKIALDHGFVIVPSKCGPRIDAHGVAHHMAVHLRHTPNDDFIDATRHLPLHAEDIIDDFRVQGRLRRANVGTGYRAAGAIWQRPERPVLPDLSRTTFAYVAPLH